MNRLSIIVVLSVILAGCASAPVYGPVPPPSQSPPSEALDLVTMPAERDQQWQQACLTNGMWPGDIGPPPIRPPQTGSPQDSRRAQPLQTNLPPTFNLPMPAVVTYSAICDPASWPHAQVITLLASDNLVGPWQAQQELTVPPYSPGTVRFTVTNDFRPQKFFSALARNVEQ